MVLDEIAVSLFFMKKQLFTSKLINKPGDDEDNDNDDFKSVFTRKWKICLTQNYHFEWLDTIHPRPSPCATSLLLSLSSVLLLVVRFSSFSVRLLSRSFIPIKHNVVSRRIPPLISCLNFNCRMINCYQHTADVVVVFSCTSSSRIDVVNQNPSTATPSLHRSVKAAPAHQPAERRDQEEEEDGDQF